MPITEAKQLWGIYLGVFPLSASIFIIVGVILVGVSVPNLEMNRILTEEYPFIEIPDCEVYAYVTEETSPVRTGKGGYVQTTTVYYLKATVHFVFKNSSEFETITIKYDSGSDANADADYYNNQTTVPCYYSELPLSISDQYDVSFVPVRLSPYKNQYFYKATLTLAFGIPLVGVALLAFAISFPIMLWRASRKGFPVRGCNCHEQRTKEQEMTTP